MKDASLIKIRVNAAAKKKLKEAAAEFGWKQEAIASRIYLWWSEQDDEVRRLILGMQTKEDEADAARRIFERLAATKPKSK